MGQVESRRVVVAEDDYLVGTLIVGLLEKQGYTVVGRAATGARAVELVEATRPDVVLIDIGLPDGDGIEASRLIGERCPTPVVIITAYDSAELVQRASAAGVGAYLVKPPDAGQMERAIVIARQRFADLAELRRLNAELRASEDALRAANRELESRLREIKTLQGYLPICASCKKIRDDQGYWHAVEVYIRDHTDVEFTHGLCPDCARKIMDELGFEQ